MISVAKRCRPGCRRNRSRRARSACRATAPRRRACCAGSPSRRPSARRRRARSSATSRDSEVRASCMVSTTPWISSRGLSVARIWSIDLLELRNAFQREELTLHRHQHGMCGRHGVERQNVERRRAIDQHVAERPVAGATTLVSDERRHRIAQLEGPSLIAAELALRYRQDRCSRAPRKGPAPPSA